MRRVKAKGPTPFVAGLIAIALCLIGVYFAQTKEVPFRHHYELKAAFASSNGLKRGMFVRLAGVTIGKVVKTRPYGDGASLVTMRINQEGLPIHRDARLKIRPRLFLEGNFFIDVSPGTPGSPLLKDGDVVPVQQTATPVQFDQVLSALQSDTREDLKVVLKEYGRALKIGAGATNRTFRYTGPAYRDSAIVADAQLGTRPHDLSDYVRDGGTVNRALDRNPHALKTLITSLYVTARGFAREDDNLERTLAELPRTLRTGLPALRDLNRAFPPLRGLIRDLKPALRSSPPALDASLALTRQLRPLVGPRELRGLAAGLRAAIPDLARLNREGIPLGEQTRLASSCQNEVMVPWSAGKVPDKQFPAKAPIYEEGARAFPGLSGESRSGDANGQWFRVFVNGGNYTYQLDPGEFFQTAAPILGTNPPPPSKYPPPLRPDAACETQETPDMRTVPGAPPQRIATQADPARAARAERIAVAWLRKQVRRQHLTGKLGVRSQPVTASELRAP